LPAPVIAPVTLPATAPSEAEAKKLLADAGIASAPERSCADADAADLRVCVATRSGGR